MTPTLEYEQQLWQQGLVSVAGVDEVGRGAWAGPVVTAAVVLPADIGLFASKARTVLPKLLRDSKMLSSDQRHTVDYELKNLNLAWAIGLANVAEINTLGVGQATFLAMERALDQLVPASDYVLMDGFKHPNIDPSRQQAIVKGDARVASIAAASILAKVHRDDLMERLDHQFPGYGLALHKGYGTKVHQQAILQLGLSEIHRTSFHLKFLAN